MANENPPTTTLCAVIGDIVGSRRLPDRASFQGRFLRAVAELNRNCRPGLVVSRFAVTTGDEFQGLLRSPGPAYDILVELGSELGVSFRLGVGWGRVDTALRPEAVGMDGPAFHLARAALLAGKATGRSFSFRSGSPPRDDLVDSHAALLERLRRSWTERQREVIQAVETHGTQAAAAIALGVTPAAVSQVLSAAQWSLFVEARRSLSAYLYSLAEWNGEGPSPCLTPVPRPLTSPTLS